MFVDQDRNDCADGGTKSVDAMWVVVDMILYHGSITDNLVVLLHSHFVD